MATIFNVMRLIFETMRQRNATVVIENDINTSTPLIFTEPYQNSSSESDMC